MIADLGNRRVRFVNPDSFVTNLGRQRRDRRRR